MDDIPPKKDKYGYHIPNKAPIRFQSGKGQEFQEFENHIYEIADIVTMFYPDDDNENHHNIPMISRRFNLVLSVISELMSRVIRAEIDKHENNKTPLYAKTIIVSEKARRKMQELLIILDVQEKTLTHYLSDSPELIRDENKIVVQLTKNAENYGIAKMMEQEFNNAWNEQFKNDIPDHKKK